MRIKLFRTDMITVFFSMLLFFYFFTYFIFSDIQLHSFAVKMINDGKAVYPPNFLYYLTVNAMSNFSKNMAAILLASCMILALSMTAKYEISRFILKQKLLSDGYTESEKKLKALIIFISFCLILFFPIQDYIGAFEFRKYYYGKIVPNVWHNSTTIFLFPFALSLFWRQYKELISDFPITYKSIFILSLLVAVNIFIKPSFFIVYAPVSLVFLYIKHRISTEYLKNVISIVIGLILLYFMHKITYTLQLGSYNNSEGTIAFAKPFESWTYFVPGWYVPISFIHSFALPLFYIILYGKDAFSKNMLFKYVLSLTVFGLLISIFLIEDGPRKFHGNFLWQNVICSYILMLSVTYELLSKYLKEGLKSVKLKTLAVIFFLHTLSGIIYIIKIFVTKSPA